MGARSLPVRGRIRRRRIEPARCRFYEASASTRARPASMCFVAVVDVAAACAQTDVARRVAAVTSRAIQARSVTPRTTIGIALHSTSSEDPSLCAYVAWYFNVCAARRTSGKISSPGTSPRFAFLRRRAAPSPRDVHASWSMRALISSSACPRELTHPPKTRPQDECVSATGNRNGGDNISRPEHAPLAQSVEHRTFNPLVLGSSPRGRTTFPFAIGTRDGMGDAEERGARNRTLTRSRAPLAQW